MDKPETTDITDRCSVGGEMRQAGAIPYALREGRIVFLLITSSSGRWIFPKGRVEAGETGAVAAAREAQEEAGVTGETADEAVSCFGVQLQRAGGPLDAELCLYPMRVSEQQNRWPERGGRERHWVTFEELRKLVDDPRYVAAANAIRERYEDR